MRLVAALVLLAACSFSGSSGPMTTDVDGGDTDARGVDATSGGAIYRINVAGPEFVGTDYPGTWLADDVGQLCFGGVDIVLGDVQNTVDDTLFHYMRFGAGDVDIGCDLTAVNGNYSVVLHLAEIFRGGNCPGAAARDYTITIEGTAVDRFELVAANGGCVVDTNTPAAAPITRTYSTTVSDGELTLRAGMPADRGLLQAVEVFAVP